MTSLGRFCSPSAERLELAGPLLYEHVDLDSAEQIRLFFFEVSHGYNKI
jgi:hypothetical protein